MAEQEKNESFFRKVVRFVANPATDWADLSTRQEDTKELELEKSELKAMIERKRRNDFVRKREFDMLRKVRREGLSPEQLATLGTSSRLDDSEARQSEAAPRPDGVKAKIDEIEQQMVGEGGFSSSSRRGPLEGSGRASAYPPAAPAPAPLAPLAFDGAPAPARPNATSPSRPARDEFRSPAPAPLGREPAAQGLPSSPNMLPDIHLPPASAPAPVQMVSGLPPLAPLSTVSFDTPPTPTQTTERAGRAAERAESSGRGERAEAEAALAAPATDFGSPFAVEVSEVMHDPDLDEAVIAFANADFTQCEEALQRLTSNTGARSQHAETWLVLFDLYRATGQQHRFESLALDYAQQFGWSAPQWYSLPKLVADKLADEPLLPSSSGANSVLGGDVGWVCAELLDIEAVARLRSQTLQMPLPWVFDWSALRIIDPEAAMQLSTIFRLWAGQQLEMRWLGGDKLFQVLAESAPTGVRDADPAFWLTRLDALRLANRADQFDEAAIDYCVTYEVSPPSWEPTRCTVHISGSAMSTRNPPMSMISDVSTSFHESGLSDDAAGGIEVAHVELSGQLIGDISATLGKLQGEVGLAPVVSVSCARLIRVDFIAAGDLLNWVLARRGESRSVHFVDAHRLLALFFGAMGINEHAKVQVRKV
jgi:hypothetical protein